MPLQPKLLDYANTQVLLIGSGMGDLVKATNEPPKSDKTEGDGPLEEIERLEHEDELRVEHLRGAHISTLSSIFEEYLVMALT